MLTLFKYFAVIAVFCIHFSAAAQSAGTINEKHFIYGDGSQAFVLSQPMIDNQAYDATLQMDTSSETWTLEKSQGMRGTVLYRNDTGRIFLRVNHMGGATLYPTPDSMGVPVLQKSQFRFEAGSPLAAEPDAELTSIEDWSRVYAYAGNKTEDKKTETSVSANNILFADWPASKSAYKTALIAHLSDLMENRETYNVERIIVKIGEEPTASHDENGLTIWVNPALGFAGRPSTEKILEHLAGKN